MRILMVDDSDADRRLCRALLEEIYGNELEFCEARNALQGLEMCRSAPPECILLDYKLPDMSGNEFLRRLTGGIYGGRTASAAAIVMLTGLGSEHIAAEAMRNGAQDYLIKDQISASTLHMAVEKASEKIRLLRELHRERNRLTASLAEKDVLLQEVHHRVKNNLQVIASLLQLQAASIQDERVARALQESQQRVEAMALIHEQLYQTRDLRQVDMVRHIVSLAGNLVHSYGADESRISWTVSVEPFSLPVDRAIPLGLILNELISNVLKHAFPAGRRGLFSIAGGRSAEGTTLEVKDDGIGLPPSLDVARPRSLGLQIVAILARQIKGTFELRTGRGTTARLTLPELRQEAS
jgi:two-component sensor histidine kinase